MNNKIVEQFIAKNEQMFADLLRSERCKRKKILQMSSRAFQQISRIGVDTAETLPLKVPDYV